MDLEKPQLRLKPLTRLRAGKYRTEDGRFTIERERATLRGGWRWLIEARDYADAGIEDGYTGTGYAQMYLTLAAAEAMVMDVYRCEHEEPLES